MARSLNFNTIKKEYLTVTLPNKKTIMIGTPTKAIMKELISIQESLDDVDENNATAEDLDSLYIVCAKIMSRNKGGVTITPKDLEKDLDFEDIKIFLREYMDYMSEVMSSKN